MHFRKDAVCGGGVESPTVRRKQICQASWIRMATNSSVICPDLKEPLSLDPEG